MAIGPIEMSAISRSQDLTTMKHNEVNKSFVDQSFLGQQQTKTTEQMARQVQNSDNADWHHHKEDAKEKGRNEYHGDGGQKRRGIHLQEGHVLEKSSQQYHGIDLKI
jgi:hypothetical protein